MKKILITNNHFREFKGSEIVTLELVEYFCQMGWEVSVFSNLYLPPIADICKNINYPCHITDDDDLISDDNFDLIWIQHSVLPRSIIMKLGTIGLNTNIIWNHMSSFIHQELPIFADLENQIADISLAISTEVENKLTSFGLAKEKICLFNNPAPDYFFNNYKNTPLSQNIKSVVVISNHIPPELSQALSLLEEIGIKTKHFGGHNTQRITPIILKDFDAIITIGKTVQYALALRIPIYEYDYLGGCGWLNANNFNYELSYNFSGRPTQRKLTAQQIIQELITGYQQATHFINSLTDQELLPFKLSYCLNYLLKSLPNNTYKKISYTQALQFNSYNEIQRGYYRTMTYYKDQLELNQILN